MLAVACRGEFEWTKEQMDGTSSSPNCVRLLYLDGINRKQTKGCGVFWVFFFFSWGDVVLVSSAAAFQLHTLALLQVRKKEDCSCPLRIGPEAPGWTLVAQGLTVCLWETREPNNMELRNPKQQALALGEKTSF